MWCHPMPPRQQYYAWCRAKLCLDSMFFLQVHWLHIHSQLYSRANNGQIDINIICIYWLVVSTPLKNISPWEGLSHILWKLKKCLKPPNSIYIYIYILNISWFSSSPWNDDSVSGNLMDLTTKIVFFRCTFAGCTCMILDVTLTRYPLVMSK